MPPYVRPKPVEHAFAIKVFAREREGSAGQQIGACQRCCHRRPGTFRGRGVRSPRQRRRRARKDRR